MTSTESLAKALESIEAHDEDLNSTLDAAASRLRKLERVAGAASLHVMRAGLTCSPKMPSDSASLRELTAALAALDEGE